jgi:CubicO group peptidase (beta-lactamase class C family)
MQRRTMLMAGPALSIGMGAAPDALAGPLMDILQGGEALPGLRAVVVARQGRVLAERGYGGASTDTLQPVNSVTKSVCSMLVGQALRDGVLTSLDQTVAELLPEAVAEVPGTHAGAVTLRQLLAGRSGLGFDLSRFGELLQARSLTRFVLGQPAVAVPPALQLAVATAATSPPPPALRAQTDGVMTLVGRLPQALG